MTFTAVITVRDRRRPGARGEAVGRAIAAAGHLPLTVLEVDHGDQRTTPDAGHDLRLLVPAAAIGPAVIDHVRGRDDALLVIDAHGGGPPGDALFDRDAEHILQRGPRPVLVLGPHADETLPATTLLVPSDGAGLVGSAVPVVRSWIEGINDAAVTVLALGAVDSWPATDDAPAPDDAERAVAALVADGIRASLVRSTVAEPDEAILAACANHGRPIVVVAAPRWSGAVTHWFSTTRRLIRRAPCPVLVVPAELDDDDRRPG